MHLTAAVVGHLSPAALLVAGSNTDEVGKEQASPVGTGGVESHRVEVLMVVAGSTHYQHVAVGGVAYGIVDHLGLRRVVLAQTDIDDAGTVVYGIAYGAGHVLVVLVAIGAGTHNHQLSHVGGNTAIAGILPGIAGNDASHECAVLTALHGQRGIAIEAVVGIVHVVAHEQTLVGVVLYAVDILCHFPQTCQRQRVETVQRLAGYLVVAQVVVNLGLLAHPQIEVVLLLVPDRVATGYLLVFGEEALELPELLSAGADHVERAVGSTQEVPAVQVVAVAVAVGVATVGPFSGIGP